MSSLYEVTDDMSSLSLSNTLKAAVCCKYYDDKDKFRLTCDDTTIILQSEDAWVSDSKATEYKDDARLINWEPYRPTLLKWFLASPYVICVKPKKLIEFMENDENIRCFGLRLDTEEVSTRGVAIGTSHVHGMSFYKEKDRDQCSFCVASFTLLHALMKLDGCPVFERVRIMPGRNSITCAKVRHVGESKMLFPCDMSIRVSDLTDMLFEEWIKPISGSLGPAESSAYENISKLISGEGHADKRISMLLAGLRSLDKDLPDKLEVVLEQFK